MDEAATDARLRTALVRNRLVLTVCTGGLAAAVPVLAAIGAGDTASVVGLCGVAALVAASGALTLDSWLGWHRPAPRILGETVVVRAHPASFVAVVVAAAGLALIALSFLVEPGGPGSVADGRRGGLLVFVVIPLAPLLLVGALLLLVRRDRVVLDLDGVHVRRLGRTTSVRWEDVQDVVAVPDNPGLMVRIVRPGARDVLVGTRQLDLTTWEMRAVLLHHARTPADRVRLGEPASLSRIAELRSGAAVPGEGPSWFPAPRGGVA